ncbi:MAG: ABC transporter ATP-binding protein [Anaerolineales bacterium]|nr:ABC transporter ATP-binding protein [Anaerolineales bacterium]
MDKNPIIEVTRLNKKFGDIQAVDNVSFTIQRGEIYSLLGPNGAGKSTTISMLACLLEPDNGDVLINSFSIKTDPMKVKKQLGLVPQEIALYEDLSARENLLFWGKMYELRGKKLQQRCDEVLDIIGLSERQKGAVSKYSGGMKRRLNIGIALLHTPPVIILDEPTVGIDPQSRRNILDSIMDLNRQGTTVIYTTHYMEEAQEISNRIAIMDYGKIIAGGTHEELIQIVGELDRVSLTLSTDIGTEIDPLLKQWRTLDGIHNLSSENGKLILLAENSNLILPALFETAARHSVRITSVEVQEPNLEAVFLHLTGRALRDPGVNHESS